MKNYVLFILLSLIVFSSCGPESCIPGEEHFVDPFYVNESLQEYLDYYEANDELIFERESSLTDKTSYPKEYWTFRSTGEPTSTMEKSTYSSCFSSVDLKGYFEEKKMTYLDDSGNQITLILEPKALLNDETLDWEHVQDQFVIKYSYPCQDIYLDYLVNQYRERPWSIKKKTLLDPTMEVGDTIYNDVMKLETIKEGSHFSFFATKDEGIIKIKDLDNDKTWIKAKNPIVPTLHRETN